MEGIKPQSVFIAIARTDGGVSIMSLLTLGRGNVLPPGAVWADRWLGYWEREPTDEVIRSEIEKAVPASEVVSWRRVELSEIPQDRTFRDAWTDTGRIEHDMGKAREIHRKRIRGLRQQAMADLDGHWMRATGANRKAEADAVEAKRQMWRDAPADPRIDAAQTVDDLKAIAPPAT